VTSTDFKPGDRVAYIPYPGSKEREHGVVSGVGKMCVFVKFDKHVRRLGLKGATAWACLPEDLERING
jgi:hypothetical protein